jgi:hypothetical protein
LSVQTALDNIRLKPTARWGHTEYSMGYHKEYIRKATGLDPADPRAYRAFADAWEFDFHWSVDNGLHGDWAARGRATDMGHAEYAADGADRREAVESPFHSPQDVWAFDPDAEYGLPVFEGQVAAYEKRMADARSEYPGQLTTGGYYLTAVSGAIQAFGWDMFLLAAADRRRIASVLERFLRRTQFHMEAWARTSAEVVIQHDDFVWTSGAFMHPDVYRGIIIPGFAELWKPLHRAGKKVLFCSDGNFMEFAEDIVAAGADGLIFEPDNDFGWMAERFGASHCLVGSFVDCRDMTFGTMDKVRADIDRTFEKLRKCRGAILAVGNHIPANVSDAMCDSYFGRLRERLAR